MVNIMKVMADNKLDAIVHKTVEHQPPLIKDGINPPYLSARGVPTWNTFLIYAASMTVPSGFDADGLPVGITFFGPPLQRTDVAQARLWLRAGDETPQAAEDDTGAARSRSRLDCL